MSANKIYYYLKAGFSNCLLDMGRIASDPDSAYMWIGYESLSFEKITQNLSKDKVHFERKDTAVPTDTLNLYTMSHPFYRDQIRVITFSNSLFEVWEFAEGLTPMTQKVRSLLFENISSSSEDMQKWILSCFSVDSKYKQKNRPTADRIKDFENRYLGEKSRFVKLRRVFHCHRTELPPTINSLSVYQGFSRGTFRPIASADSGKEEALSEIFKNKDTLITVKNYMGRGYTERRFGYFIRKYISFVSDPLASDFFKYMELDHVNGLKLILNTLNPGQMETAAMLLISDLGFIAEIGVANALDSIDIRGRLPQETDPELILKKIKSLHLPINQSIREKLVSERVIEIQCKAYQPHNVSRKDIVFFTPSAKSHVSSAIHWSLEQIQNHLQAEKYVLDKSADWYLLNNWLLNIKEGFSRKPQSLKFKFVA